MKEQSRIKLMVTILDRGRGARAVELFAGAGIRQHYATPGRGTANSDILDYLGLGETEKDVLLTLPNCEPRGPEDRSGKGGADAAEGKRRPDRGRGQ